MVVISIASVHGWQIIITIWHVTASSRILCLWLAQCIILQNQQAVTAYLKSKQLLPFGFARWGWDAWIDCCNNTRDLESSGSHQIRLIWSRLGDKSVFGTMNSGQAPDWPVDGSSDAWWGAYAFYLHNTLFGDVVQWSLCTWLEEWGGGCTSPHSSSPLPPPHLSPPPPLGRTPDLNIIRPDVNSPVLIAPLWRPGRSHKFIPNEASPERNQATWAPSGHHGVKDVG